MITGRYRLREQLSKFLGSAKARRGLKLTCVILVLHMLAHLYAIVTATRATHRLGVSFVDASFVARAAFFVVGVPLLLYLGVWLLAFLLFLAIEARRRPRTDVVTE